MPQERRSKYRAVKTVVDGFTFASKAESRRYTELLLFGMAGYIQNLELQPRFPLVVNGVCVATYVADFRYQREVRPLVWEDVIEDVKGMKTPAYRLKKKLFEALYLIPILETR